MPHYLTQAEAERAVGGAPELKQLAPLAGYSTADPVTLEDWLSATDGIVRTYIGLSFDLDSFDAMYFNQAIQDQPQPARPMSEADKSATRAYAQDVFADIAWSRGANRLAKPADAAERAKTAQKGLEAMGKRLQALGANRKPGSSRGYRRQNPGGVGEYTEGTPMSKFRGFR